MAAGVPEQIAGDERRIRQILINLLGNAVKFTSHGSVTLLVATSSAGGNPALDFSVEDTGIGIPPETIGLLFQPFAQVDSTMSRPFGGTGLGLAISQRLAEAMGGSISVVSTPGKGSTFTLRLEIFPCVSSAPESAPLSQGGILPLHLPKAPAPTARGLVLVVEDDPDNSRLAGQMLLSLGYRVEFAAQGAEAVAAFTPGKFSAILMDMLMPVMDGLVATKQIRERESGSRVPIIALTGNVVPGECGRCLAAGMDDFLSKPFKRDELAAKLARAISPRGAAD
jgi:CheY-like chemotaxis protein